MKGTERRNLCTGFTLIELMVVIAVMASLSGILLTYSRASEVQIAMDKDQAVIAGMFYRAKSLAIEKLNSNPDACGFGVHAVKNPTGNATFTIFQDLIDPANGPNAQCRDGGYHGQGKYVPGVGARDEDLETYTTDPRVLVTLQDGNDNSWQDLIYIPPDPTTFAPSGNSLPYRIGLAPAGQSVSTWVVVSDAGQITTN